MNSQLILLLLAVAMILAHGKSIPSNNGENDLSEEQAEMFHSNHRFNRPQMIEEMLFKLLKNKQDDQYNIISKRAKSIIKGDPREFMG